VADITYIIRILKGFVYLAAFWIIASLRDEGGL
jgi:hypothetical protein